MARMAQNKSVLRAAVLLWAGLCISRSTVDLLNVHLEIQKSRKKKERKTKDYSQRRKDVSVSSVTRFWKNRDFERYLRMKRSTFEKLLLLVGHKLHKNVEMGQVAGRPTISPDVRLAIFLRRMAGGCPHDIAATFETAPDTVHKIFETTRMALDEVLTLPGLPTSFEELKEMADDFQTSRSSGNPLPGCVGALDGIAIKISKPQEWENPASYWCRKGYYAIPVQAMCDSQYRFRTYSAKCSGSTHDALAHFVSSLYKHLEEGNLPVAFWIAGDEAYVCTVFLVTPVPGTQATEIEDAFNYYQSSSRMHIEQAFGMVVKKWCLLKKLEFSVKKSREVVHTAMLLHNFCIDHNGTVSCSQPRAEQQKMLENSKEWYRAGKHAYVDEVDRQDSAAKRDLLIDIIKKGGYKRPLNRCLEIPSYYEVINEA